MSSSFSNRLTSAASLQRARSRVKELTWAHELAAGLAKTGRKFAAAPLPRFETAWWKDASKKHWTQTYPEINRHTYFAVQQAASGVADAAYASALTGDDDCLRAARRALLHFAGYRFFARHPDVGLNWSVWCMRLLFAFDLVQREMDHSERARVADFLRRAGQAVRENDEWWIAENPGGLYNNHFAWHKVFIGSLGVFFGEEERVQYALEADQGVRDLIEQGTLDDGLWLEGSLNYHFTALWPLALFARLLRESGSELDLWTHEFANGRCLRELITGPIQAAFPDRTLPTIGDTYGRRLDLASVDLYYLAYDALRLPEIGWLLNDRDKPPLDALFLQHLPPSASEAPSISTRLWPAHGYVALRSDEGSGYWDGRGFSAFLTHDRDGIHGHHDKLSFTAFGRGRHLAVDAESVASEEHKFSARIQKELNYETICHNTLLVDGRRHGPVRAKLHLLDYVDNASLKMATVADGGVLYEGVRVMRTLAVADWGIVDVLQAVSGEQHTYDYLFHGVDDAGEFRPCPGREALDGFVFPEELPWSWLRGGRSWTTDKDWSVVARQGSVWSLFTMAGAAGTRVILSQFPRTDSFEPPAIPMLIARRTADSALFVALLQAGEGEPAVLDLKVSERPHNLLRISIGGDRQQELSVPRLA